MKSVLISIRPEWCEKIINGKKTIEIRKTKPKLDTPFKCYIYCTKGKTQHKVIDVPDEQGGGVIDIEVQIGGKVIGEFVCDKVIYPFSLYYSDKCEFADKIFFTSTCLTDNQIIEYLGNGKEGYAWHISDLIIYDEPKELSEFGIKRPPQSWQYIDEVIDNG